MTSEAQATESARTSGSTTRVERGADGRAFRTLVAREGSAFWRTRAWWVQGLAYLLLVDGLTGLATLGVLRSGEAAGNDGASGELAQLFFVFHLVFVSAGTIVAAQRAVLGEKSRGTAAWILSKPVSRSAFLVAKALTLGANAVAVGVLAPVAVMVPLWWWTGFTVSPTALAVIIAGLALLVVFFSSLTLMLGALLESTSAVTGTALVVLFAMIQSGQAFPHVLPGGIPFVLAPLLNGGALPTVAPFLVTCAAIGACLAVAVGAFRRTEF